MYGSHIPGKVLEKLTELEGNENIHSYFDLLLGTLFFDTYLINYTKPWSFNLQQLEKKMDTLATHM